MSIVERVCEWGNDQMNALEVLKQDHQKVKGLFQAARHAAGISKQKDLFDRIDTELDIHTAGSPRCGAGMLIRYKAPLC
jgi:hypothetical protein